MIAIGCDQSIVDEARHSADTNWSLHKDNIHQNELGTMVNAWMFYTMLTGKSPVGVDFDIPPFVVDGVMRKTPEFEITPELRRELQQRVWKISQAWRSGQSHLE